MTAAECFGMARASIKASASPLMLASAVPSTRLLCCRTALMQKPDMSAYRELETVYTRDKAELRQSVMQPGERKSVWQFLQPSRKSTLQSRDRMMPFLWTARQAEMARETGMER
jgi:hypothetical protein